MAPPGHWDFLLSYIATHFDEKAEALWLKNTAIRLIKLNSQFKSSGKPTIVARPRNP